MGSAPWLNFPNAEALIAHYGERSTRDLSSIAWYEVLACYKLGIILEGTHARAFAGKAPKATGDVLHATLGRLALFFRTEFFSRQLRHLHNVIQSDCITTPE